MQEIEIKRLENKNKNKNKKTQHIPSKKKKIFLLNSIECFANKFKVN